MSTEQSFKLYAPLLLVLPPEYSENSPSIRKLRGAIDKVLRDLAVLGLRPATFHEHALSEQGNAFDPGVAHARHRVQTVGDDIEGPSLRLWIRCACCNPDLVASPSYLGLGRPELRADVMHDTSASLDDKMGTLCNLLNNHDADGRPQDLGPIELPDSRLCIAKAGKVAQEDKRELVFPLALDDQLTYDSLSDALQGISDHLLAIHSDFTLTLAHVTECISQSVQPVSSSRLSQPRLVSTWLPTHLIAALSPTRCIAAQNSDLYAWREIFQCYLESQVFEAAYETEHQHRAVQDAEQKLRTFSARLTRTGLRGGRKFKRKDSSSALRTFLWLNAFILNIRKIQLVNAEAVKEIVDRRRAQNDPRACSGAEWAMEPPAPREPASYARVLVQAVCETLLPIIPHVVDFACSICTWLAFKPIRLSCGHRFCVRCLVKLQREGKPHCPMCRGPTVLAANESNLDLALLNFLRDWFPLEIKAKQAQDRHEIAREHWEAYWMGVLQPI